MSENSIIIFVKNIYFFSKATSIEASHAHPISQTSQEGDVMEVAKSASPGREPKQEAQRGVLALTLLLGSVNRIL